MAKIVIVDGSLPVEQFPKPYKIVDSIDSVPFRIKNIFEEETTKIIDMGLKIFDIPFIKWVICNSNYNCVIMFPAGKPAGLTKSELKPKTNIIEHVKGNKVVKDGLFDLLDLIVKEKNRREVYRILSNNVSRLFIVVKYLISNASIFDQRNITTLSYIDLIALNKNSETTIRLLAYSMKPCGKSAFFWKWNYPTKEDGDDIK
jgi:hypothetical protein